MKTLVARFIAPLTLFEWGAIFTYFYFSHRIAAFLRPGFRPFVLMTGIVLLLVALCVLFFPVEGGCADATDDLSRSRLTKRKLLAFIVLLLPIALAAKISPDSFDRTLIENRGAAETAEAVHGMMSRPVIPMPHSPPVFVGVDQSAPSPQNAFRYSASVDVPETPDYPSNAALAQKLRNDADSQSKKASSVTRNPAGLIPLNDRPGAVTAFGTLNSVLDMSGSPLNQDSFQPKKRATISAEVVDLLIAARKPSLMKAFDGQTVEMVGQFLPDGKSSFKLLRLLMICCAADAQPLAVRVESKQTLPDMAWAKVVGKVAFASRGGKVVPVVTAEKVTRIKQPEEPYIY